MRIIRGHNNTVRAYVVDHVGREVLRRHRSRSTPSPFRHIALKVDAYGQAELERRLKAASWKPEGAYVLEHGYCRSLYTEDPNGMLLEFTVDVPEVDEIAKLRASDAHNTLKRWLAGDHTSKHVPLNPRAGSFPSTGVVELAETPPTHLLGSDRSMAGGLLAKHGRSCPGFGEDELHIEHQLHFVAHERDAVADPKRASADGSRSSKPVVC